MKRDIGAEAALAIEVLEQLTKDQSLPEAPEVPKRPLGTPALDGTEITAAQGVAFISSKKAGLGLSVSHGHGFLVAKVSGKPGWSAPLPFHITSSGLGVTIGYSEVDTILILDTQAAVEEFLKTQVSLDSHLSVSAGSKLSADASETALDVRTPRNTLKRFQYSVSKGVMIDASWNGSGISVKDEEIKELYGEGVQRADVLAGRVASPACMMPLYGALNRVSFFSGDQGVVEGMPVAPGTAQGTAA